MFDISLTKSLKIRKIKKNGIFFGTNTSLNSEFSQTTSSVVEISTMAMIVTLNCKIERIPDWNVTIAH